MLHPSSFQDGLKDFVMVWHVALTDLDGLGFGGVGVWRFGI